MWMTPFSRMNYTSTVLIHCKYPVSADRERFTFCHSLRLRSHSWWQGRGFAAALGLCISHGVPPAYISAALPISVSVASEKKLPLFPLAATAVQCFLWYLPLHNCLTAVFSPYLLPASHHFPAAQLPGLAHIANAFPKLSRSSSSLAGLSFWKLTVRLCSTVQM